MNLLSKEHHKFLYFISFIALIRVILAPHVGLGVDEAHYVLYALNLDLSYFDHPPLVGWIQYLCTSLFSTDEFGARVAAILIGVIVSLSLYNLLYSINSNSTYAFIALLSLYASFIFNALFIMLMPDTLLFVLIIPIILTVIKIEQKNKLSSWIILGLLLGLAGLSKYTAVLFIPPIILYLLFKKRYELFYSLNIIPSIIVALLVISPVIVWNIQNDWISFTYQSNHVVGEQSIHWSGFFRSLAAQLAAYNPLLAPLAFYGLYKSFRSKNDTLILTAFFGLILILFFTYASLYKTALPHWSALFYMLFIPIGSYFMLFEHKKYITFAIGFGLLVSTLAYLELGFKFIPQPDFKSIHRDIYGWKTIMSKANQHIKNHEAIAVTNWSLASRAIYYNRDYNSSVYLIDKRKDQFDLWEKASPIGKDLIIINTKAFRKDIDKYIKCDFHTKLENFDIILHHNRVNNISLEKCSNFKGIQ